ncbi:nickel-dependent hydrogenase large subunit [Nocardioides sp. GY 10127]|uniref:nickel-dependent hydrogenase large subunit n=1 Tax=Nocardioides sp. GY 10127 TaxID=2569762 RepID=UPI0010A87D7A|nr:nickel-dependent hydrogenase large subunit [Nocardioides sp. GY 10127]TIC80207.1 nickel-dependent hydrogenase large subunit [Nocardioides sp. GY 10127]
MSTTRVVIDPLTRIEGHLRMELEAADGAVSDAWCEVTQFRGIEMILKGRDPRDAWAFAQRICGVCTAVHAVASVVAVEDALDYAPPIQAQRIRELVLASQTVQDHVVHFYHLQALDWVNVPNAAKASPAAAAAFAANAGSTWTGNSVERMAEVKETLTSILASGQESIFTNGYWDHPAYELPPAADLMAVAHYLDALEFQRTMIRVGTVFGGKNPHPNFLVGGMACSIDVDSQTAVNQVDIDSITAWIDDTVTFVTDCYYPDVLALMKAYKPWFSIGRAADTYLAAGMAGAVFQGDPNDTRTLPSLSPVMGGVLLDGDLSTVHPIDTDKIAEYVTSAWYSQDDPDAGLHPSKGETEPDYTGPELPWEWIADEDRYTWSKSPRYDGRVTQVGPLARVLMAYAQGHDRTVELVDEALKVLRIELKDLNSTAGRILTRAIEAVTAAELMRDATWAAFTADVASGTTDVFNAEKWEPKTWPSQASGFGMIEVARGNLSHWVTIEDGEVARYQAVVPTTWLSGGRDAEGKPGPYEQSLTLDTHPLVDPKAPLEALRTIHSFDPCMSCAVHVLDPEGAEIVSVTTS